MSFDVTTLDRRHSGIQYFKYFISHKGRDRHNNIIEFIKWRDWAQDTWGHGIDRDWAWSLQRTKQEPRVWGWFTDDNKVGNQPRLYLKGDGELTLFKLKWA